MSDFPQVCIKGDNPEKRKGIINVLRNTQICEKSEINEHPFADGLQIIMHARYPELNEHGILYILEDQSFSANFMDSEAEWLLESEVNHISLERAIRSVLRRMNQVVNHHHSDEVTKLLSAIQDYGDKHLIENEISLHRRAGHFSYESAFELLSEQDDLKSIVNQRISSSEALFEAIVTNSLHVVQLIDPHGTILYTSPSVKMVLGFSSFEMDTNNLCSFIHPEDQEQFRVLLKNLSSYRTSSPLLLRILNHKKLWVWMEMQFVNLLHDKAVNSIVANYRDITGRIDAEAKLKSSNNELQTFIYKASHDLRGPLASIIGLTRIGKSSTDHSRIGHIMSMIETSANKLDSALMKLVQSMTIRDAKRFHDVIDFEEIIQEALNKYEYYPGFTRLRVTVVVNKNYELISNRLILQSIVQNLIENAIKYQNPHAESFLHIQVGGTPNETILVFEDNGIGIERSIQEKIFEMYFRGTQKSNGSGLGLYLVKTGVDKLGGNITVLSEVGIGSTFILTLPANQQEVVTS